MCGIAGIYSENVDAGSTLSKMLSKLHHRGPDDIGIWKEGCLHLGHRRLSIVDLSPAGHQPMISASGDLVLTYNGEIYNFPELRQELGRSSRAPQWRGHSDTEVLLACIEAWGIRATLERCNGMFAFALWDRSSRTLTLARDRMGEKPLYFGWLSGRFGFSSELKAFSEVAGWSPRMNLQAISTFLSVGYVRGLHSAINGVYRLPPGTMLALKQEELASVQTLERLFPRLEQYWSLKKIAIASLERDGPRSADDSLEALGNLLHDAVAKRMVADVPVGAFLSGGIDSSLITAIMQQHSNRPIRTFSIGFHEPSHDEAPYARAVAKHIGTDHTELYLDADDALGLVPSLASTFDEPFADSSQLPTLLVSKLARTSVTVALSGDGGDELFAGYGRYVAILKLWHQLHRIPGPLRHASTRLLAAMATAATVLTPLDRTLPHRFKRLGERIQFDRIDDLRLSFIAGGGFTRIQSDSMASVMDHCRLPASVENPLRRVLFADQTDYLPDDILHKVDRASMLHSLETRIPLLDHRIVELSWHMSHAALMSGSRGKLPLRELLNRYVPASLIERPKRGFAPPIAQWLRGPLRDWSEQLLSTNSLQDLPLIKASEVRKLWREHLNLKIDASQVLWNILMLCNWRTYMRIGS